MKLSETENVFECEVYTRPSVKSNELVIEGDGCGICLDQTTAAELLPALQYFIEHGELPK